MLIFENVTKQPDNWTSGHVADTSHVANGQNLTDSADTMSVTWINFEGVRVIYQGLTVVCRAPRIISSVDNS